jgi:anaerobic selenocysteine-containing dehydrogenase
MNCHPTFCGMVVDVEGEHVLSIRGDEDNPDSRGFLCIRGQAASEIVDNPGRVLWPRVRGTRTPAAWRDASWDEALDRITETIRRVGPEAVAVWAGHGSIVNAVGYRLAPRFANLAGFQWWNPSIVCWGIGGFGISLTGPVEVNTKEDMSAHAELILLWGANLASQPNTAPHLVAARKRGARIVAIDVRRSEAFEHADESHLIRPGTDAALALALIHVMSPRISATPGSSRRTRRGSPSCGTTPRDTPRSGRKPRRASRRRPFVRWRAATPERSGA